MRRTPLARAAKRLQWGPAEATGPAFYNRVLNRETQAVGAVGRVLGMWAANAANVPYHRALAAQKYIPPGGRPAGMGALLTGDGDAVYDYETGLPAVLNQKTATAVAETGASDFNWGGFLGNLFSPVAEGLGRRLGGPRAPGTVISRPPTETPPWVVPVIAAGVGIPLFMLLAKK